MSVVVDGMAAGSVSPGVREAVMRSLIVAVVSLMMAVPLSAGGPYFAPSRLDLVAGESAEVSVDITSFGAMIPRMRFYSCDDSVATASGTLEPKTGAYSAKGTIQVTAVRPGRTSICSGGRAMAMPITVACGPVPAAEAVNARMTTRAGTPVTLSAIFPLLENSTFNWYRGRIGDTTTPLAGATADLAFTPDAAGVHHVWVSVATPCSASAVEFMVDAKAGRRRAARK